MKMLSTLFSVLLAGAQWLLELVPVKIRFWVWAAVAFSAFLAFVSIDSAAADRYRLNTVLPLYGSLSALWVILIAYIALSENKE